MADSHKVALVREMIESAEASLRQARKTLEQIMGDEKSSQSFGSEARKSTISSMDVGRVVEGAFDGEKMVTKDGQDYPVPANYASKSKLVPGDVLKLTIMDDGRFVYKQIGPVPRKQIIGTLVNDNGKFKIIVKDKSYKVLLASVTYFRADVGDRVTLVVPDGIVSEWGAIEAVLPSGTDGIDVSEAMEEEEESLDYL